MDRKKTKKSKATNKKASNSEVLIAKNTKKRAASPQKKIVKKNKKTSQLPPSSVKLGKGLSSHELPDSPELSDNPELSGAELPDKESGAELSSRSSSPEIPASKAKKGGKSEKVDANGWFTKEQIFQMRTNYIVEKLNGKSKDELTDADKTFILEQVDLEIEHGNKGNVLNVSSSDKPKDTKDKKVQTIESGDLPDSSSGDEGSGDDQEQTAVEKMKLLFTEGKADSHKAEVENLMKETYAGRREFILKIRPLVFQIKQNYPLLFRFDQIKKEIARMFHAKSCDTFYANTKKYCRNIFNLCPSSDSSLQRDVAQYLDAAETKKDKETICQSGSFLLLPHLMDSKAHFVVYPDESADPTEYPHIEAPSKHDILMNTKKMKVVVENVTISCDLSFLDAVLCMLACYYIFAIIYPDSLANILIVIERLFLEVSETKRIPASVTQLMTQIKSNQI